ncbi:MAG: ABC transporter ATP-binding protein [Candidatus Eisenbacteria bacterium]
MMPARASLKRAARVLRYLAPEIRSQRGQLAAGLGLGAIVAVTEVLRPWPLQMIFDQILLPRAGAPRPFGVDLTSYSVEAAIGSAGAAIVLLSAVGGVAQYLQTLVVTEAGQRIVSRLRRSLFRHMLRLPPTFHALRSSGDLLTRLTGDVVLLRDLATGSLLDAVGAALTLLATVGVMLWLEPRLTLLSLVIVPIVAIAGGIVGQKIRRAVRRSRDREGALSGSAADALGALAAVQAYDAEGAVDEQFGRENRSALRAGLKASRLEAMLTRSLDLLVAVGVAVTLALGVWRVHAGTLTAGGLLVFLAYQRTLYRPIRQFAKVLSRAAKAGACGDRVIEILETPVEIVDRADATPAPALRGEIRFEAVSVKYPRGGYALRAASFSVPAGSTLVVRGSSGAGKSTLVSLLPRLLDPSEGRVLLDGCDTRSWTIGSLRAQIAMVFQDAHLLNGTIRQNIALGSPDASPEAIEVAVREAGLWQFTRSLPDGLETIVGERGSQLSGGERQRIAIARAAIRRAPILILDEPFAHLDRANRAEIQRALRLLARGRTVVLVTHDAEAGLPADHELRLEGGFVAWSELSNVAGGRA